LESGSGVSSDLGSGSDNLRAAVLARLKYPDSPAGKLVRRHWRILNGLRVDPTSDPIPKSVKRSRAPSSEDMYRCFWIHRLIFDRKKSLSRGGNQNPSGPQSNNRVSTASGSNSDSGSGGSGGDKHGKGSGTDAGSDSDDNGNSNRGSGSNRGSDSDSGSGSGSGGGSPGGTVREGDALGGLPDTEGREWLRKSTPVARFMRQNREYFLRARVDPSRHTVPDVLVREGNGCDEPTLRLRWARRLYRQDCSRRRKRDEAANKDNSGSDSGSNSDKANRPSSHPRRESRKCDGGINDSEHSQKDTNSVSSRTTTTSASAARPWKEPAPPRVVRSLPDDTVPLLVRTRRDPEAVAQSVDFEHAFREEETRQWLRRKEIARLKRDAKKELETQVKLEQQQPPGYQQQQQEQQSLLQAALLPAGAQSVPEPQSAQAQAPAQAQSESTESPSQRNRAGEEEEEEDGDTSKKSASAQTRS